jgi:hypothetical protein
MKKTLFIIALALAFCTSSLWAATPGSCIQTQREYTFGSMFTVTLACTGGSDGSIPNTAISSAAISQVQGRYYLYMVTAYPTAGGTAPDAADVFILDATTGEDYLGSADAGTTANKGANLIHATLPKSVRPYAYNMSGDHFFPILHGMTLKVANQATNGANYTIELVFVR